jgi:hypothetical protein
MSELNLDTKICATCKTRLPIIVFGKCTAAFDGLRFECKPCQSARAKAARAKFHEKTKARSQEYYAKNREAIARKISANREKANAYERKWRAENWEKHYAKIEKYRDAKLERTPKWADKHVVKSFYHHCPEGYHVDHFIPLRGEQVSGLHVVWNLQYLPIQANLSKGNQIKFVQTYLHGDDYD